MPPRCRPDSTRITERFALAAAIAATTPADVPPYTQMSQVIFRVYHPLHVPPQPDRPLASYRSRDQRKDRIRGKLTKKKTGATITLMSAATSLTVSLSPELERFLRDCISSGRYYTESNVILEGLKLLEERERQRGVDVAALKRKLERASAQADRGEFVQPEVVLQEIEALKSQRRVKR